MSQFNSLVWGGGTLSAANAITTTGAQLTYDALRDLGVLRVGQLHQPEWNADGLRALNQTLDAWNTERLAVYAMQRETLELSAGTEEYAYGDQSTRPVRIERAARLVSTDERPVQVLGVQQWADGWDGVYVDGDYPILNLRVRPTPTTGETLVLYTWKALTLFADAETAYGFPPGYQQALRYALGVALAPSAMTHTKISRVLLESIERQAIEAKARIKRVNLGANPITLKVDEALTQGGRFNILTGGY